MNFMKLCMVLGALLSTYVIVFNIQIRDIVHLMNRRAGLRFPASFSYATIQAEWRLPRVTNSATSIKDTVNKPNELNNPTLALIPVYETYEAMIEDDTHASKSRSFPGFSSCPYQGLRKPLTTAHVAKNTLLPKCRRTGLTPGDCQETVKYFGEVGSITAGQCEISNAIKLCTISKQTMEKRHDIEVTCDASLCKGERISLGLFSEITGIIKWRPVRKIERLIRLLKIHITSSSFSPGFALLKCENGQGIQVLSFPNILKRVEIEQENEKRRRFNINIIVQDSLSRAHFYRTLLKTASTFRDIIYNHSVPSTLLEFEKVQGHASNTYLSLQRLFAAEKYLQSKAKCELQLDEWLALQNDTKQSCTYGIEDLLSKYKMSGYSTLLQEDHCWYDEWGSFLDPRRRLGPIKDKKTTLLRWETFVKVVQKSGRGGLVDDYGISSLTCHAYETLKVTNPFSSRVPNVCFAGQHYASFFLEYAKEYAALNDVAAQPFIGYTHLLTSHDTNGKRIVNDDESLAQFFIHAAHLRNTVTIFASDHGAKATGFAAYTTQGRQEVFQPLLFIIIPDEVRTLLGAEIMNALVVNQNRLVGIQDLHDFLVSIVDPIPTPHRDLGQSITHARGLFKPVPLDRTCEQMHLNSDVLCLCEGMDKTISNGSSTVLWAAEYALGYLNNKIQEQYTKSLKWNHVGMNASDFYGYGACQRYTGVKIQRARHAFIDKKETLFFSLLVKPFDKKTVEIFDVELSFSVVNKENGINLTNLIRVSPFNMYEQCADKGVDPKFCTCHSDYRNNSRWRNELYVKFALQESFELKPKIMYLDQPCLAIVSRSLSAPVTRGRWQDFVTTYEALNACANVTYTLKLPFRTLRYTKLSLSSAKSVLLLPRTVTFLLTLQNAWKFGKFVPKFRFKKNKLT